MWDIDTQDWKDGGNIRWDLIDGPKPDGFNYYVNNRFNKADILEHVLSKTAENLNDLILRLDSYGFKFTTY